MKTETKFWYDDDGSVGLIKLNSENFVDKLQPKIYSVHVDQFRGFYLKTEHETFKTPEKLYGNIQSRVDKVIKTYKHRSNNTGILLTGAKGAGKTLLGQVLCNQMMQELEVPVILIPQAFTGSAFHSFVDQLGEAVFMFDEFAKMYKRNDSASQEDLLTLLDGVSRSKRMFIFTENNAHSISNFLLDRPSRIYYHFRYGKLDENAITEYCIDHGVKSDVIDSILIVSRQMTEFNFDIVQTVAEECVRYDVKADDVEALLTELNINFEQEEDEKFRILSVIKEATTEEVQLDAKEKAKIHTFGNSYHNEYTYVNIPKSKEAVNTAEIADFDMSSTTRQICLSKSDVQYRTDNKIIMRSHGYTVVAEPVEQMKYTSGYYKQWA